MSSGTGPPGELFEKEGLREVLHASMRLAKRHIGFVRESVTRREFAVLFLLVPTVLLAVEGVIRSDFWIFADYGRAYFRFSLTSASFWTPPVLWKAFISNYAHDTFHPHLTGNLFTYLVTMLALYPLAILADRKREFRVLVAFCLLIVPLIVSYQSLHNPMGRTAIGFSCVDGALLGVLPVFLLAAVGEQTGIEFVPLWSAGPVFFVLACLAWVAGGTLFIIGLSVAVGLTVSGMTLIYLGLGDLLEGLHYMTWPSNPFNFWGVTLALAGPYLLFFAIAPRTNVVGHLAGYFSGYVFSLLVVWDTPELTRGSLGLRSE